MTDIEELIQTETDERTGWRTVCTFDDLSLGVVRAVRCGNMVVAIVRDVDGRVFALENTCPHRGGPLAGGKLVNGELACPWHGFRFDPATGCATMPKLHPPARTVPVRRVGNDVQLCLPLDV
jgi:nitrite reductase/ring-hydroxylating ferredoxin subunit